MKTSVKPRGLGAAVSSSCPAANWTVAASPSIRMKPLARTIAGGRAPKNRVSFARSASNAAGTTNETKDAAGAGEASPCSSALGSGAPASLSRTTPSSTLQRSVVTMVARGFRAVTSRRTASSCSGFARSVLFSRSTSARRTWSV